MRKGYVILVWDGWISRTRPDNILTLLNPKLHSDGKNEYGDPINWFPHQKNDVRTDEEILTDHGLTEGEDLYYRVVREINHDERSNMRVV